MKFLPGAACMLALCFMQGAAGQKTTGRLESAIRSSGHAGQIALWVFFTDKGPPEKPGSVSPLDIVSARAIERRARVLPADRLVDEGDLPVNPAYISRVGALVTHIRQTSKWLNGVSVDAPASAVPLLEALPFVGTIDVVLRYRRGSTAETEQPSPAPESPRKRAADASLDYGASLPQVSLENIPAVHATGNSAQGVIVGIFDNGVRLQTHEAFDILRPRIIAQHDFVDRKTSVVPNNTNAGFGSHGVNTLSTIAGYKSGQIIGPAYGASFLLARTENDSSETPFEEDNWAAAIEWAESLGVQVTSTSLGYLTFDNGFTSLTWQNMDGRTSVISRAAVMAARRGVIVVNSAGNEGPAPAGQNSLIAPADADSILTAGAVNPSGVRTGFSSCGPTADGRVKPDVMAVGSSVYVASSTDPSGYTSVQGTSFSCPLTAGVAALVLNAHPEATAMQVINAIKSTAHQAASQGARPDNLYGWGIIDAMAAISALGSAPASPVALTGSEISTTGFRARWTAAPGATGYRLDVATDPDFTLYVAGYDYLSVGNATDRAVSGLSPGTAYYYRVRAIGPGGISGSPNVITVSTASDGAPGRTFSLSRSYPNPFNPGTRIEFRVPELSRVTLVVFDVLGRRVRTLIDGQFPASGAAPYFASWDGTNDGGIPAASGVYFCRMNATGASGASSRQSTKMVLQR